MKLLITGGAGFIGANLIARLVSRGRHEITVFDNESASSREHIREFDVRFVKGDILDLPALRATMVAQDAVVHLAADTSVMESIADPDHNFETNARGTFNVLKVVRECGVASVVNASTGGAILGEAEPPVHEEMVAHPLSPYGASKLAAEGYINAFSASYGIKGVSLRFSNVYGPRSYHKGSVVAHFFKRILDGQPITVFGDGSQVRDYLFVEDLAEGICQALEAKVQGIYQLGSNQPTTLNELLDAICTVTSRSLDVRYESFRAGEIRVNWCDVSKARKAFGFAPNTSLLEGLERTWHWFLSTR